MVAAAGLPEGSIHIVDGGIVIGCARFVDAKFRKAIPDDAGYGRVVRRLDGADPEVVHVITKIAII